MHQVEHNCVLQVVHFCGILGCCWTRMQYDVPCASYRPSPLQDRWFTSKVLAARAIAVFRLFKSSGRAAFYPLGCIMLVLVVSDAGWQALPSSPEPVS